MNPLNQISFVVILGLCGWIWYQGETITSIKAENHAQAQTIKQQEQANQSLKESLLTERKAVEEQRAINDEIQRESTDKIQYVRKVIQAQPCYRTDINHNALERLRK